MSVRPFIRLSLACLLPLSSMGAGCAHASTEGDDIRDPVEALDESAEMTRLRRENERLTKQLRQVEERLRLMDPDDAPTTASSRSRGVERARSSHGVPRDLPVVRVGPSEPDSVRPADAVNLGEMPNSGFDFEDDDTQSYGDAGFQTSYGSDGTASDDDYAYQASAAPVAAPLPAHDEPETSGSDVQSYRLVGTELVRATKEPPRQKQRAPKRTHSRGKSKQQDRVLSEYEAAMTVYRAGRYREAELAFDGIVTQFADHEYADNALYWKGESAYDQGHFADALAAFTGVVERYGGGNKAPDALLKIGLCYGKLGDSANARDVLTQLIDAYPRAHASRIAQERLSQFSEGG